MGRRERESVRVGPQKEGERGRKAHAPLEGRLRDAQDEQADDDGEVPRPGAHLQGRAVRSSSVRVELEAEEEEEEEQDARHRRA